VFRGGYWDGDAYVARVSRRYYSYPYNRTSGVGFRLACSSSEL
jgi:formylglycine-generating enzyme required for sulfatase activity